MTGRTISSSAPGFVFNVDAVWRLWPQVWARLFRRLADVQPVILFDRRGTGLSDRIVGEERMSLEARMDDIRAVMDAASSERAILVGLEDGFGLCAHVLGHVPRANRGARRHERHGVGTSSGTDTPVVGPSRTWRSS